MVYGDLYSQNVVKYGWYVYVDLYQLWYNMVYTVICRAMVWYGQSLVPAAHQLWYGVNCKVV